MVKNMKNNCRSDYQASKGITLIALVVTIIVLLILASIAIKLLLGDDGLIKRATTSVELTHSAELDEKVKMAIFDVRIEGRGSITTTDLLNSSLKNYLKEDEYTLQEDGTNGWIIITKYKKYKVDKDGNLEELKDEDTTIKNEITVILSPDKDLTASRKQEVNITVQSKLAIESSKVEVMWSKDNIEENKLPENFATLAQEISVTKEGNTLKGTAYNPGETESGNYYLYVKAVINGEIVIQKGGEYVLQRAPKSSNITITPTETTDTYVKVKIESTEVFEGYELQYKIDGNNWTKYTEEIKVTENTIIYGRLYNNNTKDYVETSLTINTIKCLHVNMTATEEEHKCTKCGYTEAHTMEDYSESEHRCSVCNYSQSHDWDITSTTHTCKICGRYGEHYWEQDYNDSDRAYCNTCMATHEHTWNYENSDEHSCWCGMHEQHEWEYSGSITGQNAYCRKCGNSCNHSFVEEVEDRHRCTNCGLIESHDWEEDYMGMGHRCRLCDTTYKHDFDSMTGTCWVCGYTCTSHMWDYSMSSGGEYHICTNCGYSGPHNYSTGDGRCLECGAECPHDMWSNGKCSRCGLECSHSFMPNGSYSHMCPVCGLEEPHSNMGGMCGICGEIMSNENMGEY